MRVFIAITIPDEIKSTLAVAVKRLEPFAQNVKWCERGQYHITLAFLGEIVPSFLPHVTTAVNRVCSGVAPFECHAYGLGVFGSKRNPRTLWAGIEPVPELGDLFERLRLELKKYGFKGEEDELHPHVTLGRCRESDNNRAVVNAMDADEEIEFGSWLVSRVTLYESRLTPRGPVYRAIERIPLTGA